MMNSPCGSVVAFIFARGGSKGIPGKNLRILDGKPLIGHSIDIARRCPEICRIIVSTDDDMIAQVARDFGAETPFKRPPDLATDNASEWCAWRHAVEWVLHNDGDFHVFLSLPCTAPLRSPEDVSSCIDCLCQNPETDIVVTGARAARNPYFNMVSKNSEGFVNLVVGNQRFKNRQECPEIFDLTTVAYATRPDYILKSNSIFEGKVRLVEVAAERAVDIDSPLDFEIAEFLMRRRGVR